MGVLTLEHLAPAVTGSARQWVRRAVGLAVVAPAVGLIVLAVMLFRSGGASGVGAGLFVALLGLGLLAGALMMTHAPVTIANLLEDDEEEADQPGTNGTGPTFENGDGPRGPRP